MQLQKEHKKSLLQIAQYKIDRMSPEDSDSLKNTQGNFEISNVPDIAASMKMRHSQLIKYLHQCPISRFFGNAEIKQNPNAISCEKARDLVIEMIRQHANVRMDVI